MLGDRCRDCKRLGGVPRREGLIAAERFELKCTGGRVRPHATHSVFDRCPDQARSYNTRSQAVQGDGLCRVVMSDFTPNFEDGQDTKRPGRPEILELLHETVLA